MSRNDLFLLLACAILATIVSGDPRARSPLLRVADLIPQEASQSSVADPVLNARAFDSP